MRDEQGERCDTRSKRSAYMVYLLGSSFDRSQGGLVDVDAPGDGWTKLMASNLSREAGGSKGIWSAVGQTTSQIAPST
jgi:hypothetical protein